MASRLPVEEQKKIIFEGLKIAVYEGMEKHVDVETLVDSLKNIDLSDSKKDKTTEEKIPQELSISEQRQVLENLKSELLEEQDVVQSVQTNKDRTLTKIRK